MVDDDIEESSLAGGSGNDGSVRAQPPLNQPPHFKERVSGKQFSLIIDDYIEEHNYDHIPFIQSNYDQINLLLNRFAKSPRRKVLFKYAAEIFTVVLSCFMTYSISNREPFLSAVVSQAVVVTMALVAFPEVTVASAAGAFAGMASKLAIINYGWLSLLSITVSVMWLVFNRVKLLVGFGGRIGFCVFVSMNFVALIAMISGKIPWALYLDVDQLWSQRLDLKTSILSVFASTMLSAAAGAVRLNAGIPMNPMQAPTLLVLFCLLILEPATSSQLKQVSNGLAVGSFVAMASTEHYLPTTLDFMGAGFVAGLFGLVFDPFFQGFGGKDGFSAFCGFATYMALKTVSRRMFTFFTS